MDKFNHNVLHHVISGYFVVCCSENLILNCCLFLPFDVNHICFFVIG